MLGPQPRSLQIYDTLRGQGTKVSDAPEERTMVIRPGDLAAAIKHANTLAHALLIEEPENPPRRFPIPAAGVTIGRTAPADLVLDGGAVSRKHCRIELQGDDAILSDLGSTNGTQLDGEPLTAPTPLSDGARIQIGPHTLRYECKREADMRAAAETDRDVAKAQNYVKALLPPPITDGPVHATWFFQPCAVLGGDAFGYQMIGEDVFTAYILDVSGHGVGAAMHSVSVMNVLRQRALPGTDMTDPAAVLRGLNDMFDMETHHGLFFTMWYAAYHIPSRTLTYASAGHHPGLLCTGAPHTDAERSHAQSLGRQHPAIGMMPGYQFESESTQAAPGNLLYLFSDGAFEIVPLEGPAWSLQNMFDMLRQPKLPGVSEPERLYRVARAASKPGPLDDDFSVLELRFS